MEEDEIEEKFIPSEHLEQLPNPILFDMMQHIDSNETEWLACVAVNPTTRERTYLVFIQNGEPILHQFLK